MNGLPSQPEVDAIAHFVEAVRELRASPFFVEEHTSLGVSMAVREGYPPKDIKGQFPDTNVLRALLVPFRRVWMLGEPCYYLRVVKILKRYVAEWRLFLDSSSVHGKHHSVDGMPFLRDMPLPLNDVIDIWLNTRYLHVGRSTSKGRFTRKDFDEYSRQIGPVIFEYYFLVALQRMALSFFNIWQCAEAFLRRLAKRGLTPSFAFCGSDEDGSVERVTPGFTPASDSPVQRVWRLRRRKRYDVLNRFLHLMACSDEAVASLLPECADFDEFARRSDVVLEHAVDPPSIEHPHVTHGGGCCDNYQTVLRNRRCRTGSYAKLQNGTLLWYDDYVPILRDQYVEFLGAFRQEPFV